MVAHWPKPLPPSVRVTTTVTTTPATRLSALPTTCTATSAAARRFSMRGKATVGGGVASGLSARDAGDPPNRVPCRLRREVVVDEPEEVLGVRGLQLVQAVVVEEHCLDECVLAAHEPGRPQQVLGLLRLGDAPLGIARARGPADLGDPERLVPG